MYRPSLFDDHPVALLVFVIAGVVALLALKFGNYGWLKELLMR